MPKICYIPYNPSAVVAGVLEHSNNILETYAAQGFNLTLRQLYYQLVANDLFPDAWVNQAGTKNHQGNYNRLQSAITKARDVGIIDWNHIVDRGRSPKIRPRWDDPQHFLDSVGPQHHIDYWIDQPNRVEVWVEKDALSEIVENAAHTFDVPTFACKGYTSSSAMWEAGHNRMRGHWLRERQRTVVLHLGDHDPSGIDMTRDIQERLRLYSQSPVVIERIALNMDQIEQYDPPPNPAKQTDSRYKAYRDEFGDESWELDALSPEQLTELIEHNIERHIGDKLMFADRKQHEQHHHQSFGELASRWSEVEDFLS